jgi:integrase
VRFIVWDGDLPGFGLRVEPTGRKTFIARYRAGGGRSGVLRQATLGRYGTVTVDEARSHAKRLLGAAAGGGDPVGERREARQTGLTVAEVCDWYMERAESGRLLGRRGRPIKASTLAMDRSRIETHVKPLIGRRPVSALASHDIEEMQADIAAGKTATPRPREAPSKRRRGGEVSGGDGVAARTLGMLRTIFGHALRNRIIAANPAVGARKLADQKRRIRLNLDQFRQLGEAMREAEREGESPTGLAAIRLIALTGLRRVEALSLRRERLLPGGGVNLVDSKSGPQVRPIGQAALAAIRSFDSGEGPGWIFPAERGYGHFIGLPKVLARVCKRAKFEGVTAHALRHSFASVAGDLGFTELTIAGLLGHAAGSTTAGYVHLDTALVAAADRVSAVIADALDGKPVARVIPMRETAG